MNSFTCLKSFEDFLDRNNLVVSNQKGYKELKALNRNYQIDAILSKNDEENPSFKIELKDPSSIPYVIIIDQQTEEIQRFSLWKKN